jgi:hypothetical protein
MTAHPLRLPGSAAGTMGWLWPAVEMAALASGNWPLVPDPAPLGWTCYPRIAIRAPGTDASSVCAAREFTVAILRRWGAAERCDDVTTVVSELLTNALRHALPGSAGTRSRWPIRLALVQPGPCVLCAVADPAGTLPEVKEPGCLAESGRGLHVIAALSDKWGYTAPSDTGKVVWALFATKPDRPNADHDP